MFRVVNGSGTGTRSRLDLGDIKMAGKTGTAQVRAMVSRGSVSDWKSRDHSLFVCYAPTDTPRYAMAVVVEHGTFGARAAAPIAKDCMTFLFDPGKAWDSLLAMEKGWGGTPTERMTAKYAAFTAQYGGGAPTVTPTAQATDAPPSEAARPTAPETPSPRPAPVTGASPAATPTPSPSPVASTGPDT
jgi:penicillin-binding protein 2